MSEIQHEDKEAEFATEEILEVPPEWNSVPDLIMEEEDGIMITEVATWGKGGNKMISVRRNVNILPQYLGEHETLKSRREMELPFSSYTTICVLWTVGTVEEYTVWISDNHSC